MHKEMKGVHTACRRLDCCINADLRQASCNRYTKSSDNQRTDMVEITLTSLIHVYSHTAKQAVGGRPPRYAPALSSLLPRGRRSASRSRADGNVAAVSHGQYVPTLTAAATLRVKAVLSKAAW